MDLATFKRQARRLPTDVSVFVRGRHGVGKTEVIHQLAEEFGLPVMQRRLSQLSEGDLVGLPEKKENYTTFLPMEWFVECMERPHLIFLDELDRALPEVIQSVFELCYDRTIQGKKVHDGCRIYAAGNSGTANEGRIYQVSPMDPAFLSRFWVADINPSVQEWLEWAEANGIESEIIEFIKDKPEHLEMGSEESYKQQYIYPSRRNWVRFDRTLKSCGELPKEEMSALASGFVGFHAATAFVKSSESKVSAESILSHFDSVYPQIKAASIERQNWMIRRIHEHGQSHIWTDAQVANLMKFVDTIPDELKVALHDKLTGLDVKEENQSKYVKASKDIIMEVMR